jgi:hypothetical protein
MPAAVRELYANATPLSDDVQSGDGHFRQVARCCGRNPRLGQIGEIGLARAAGKPFQAAKQIGDT